jgi:hypothetical protein
MGNLLYVLAVILVVGWALGYYGTNIGGSIHILLVIAGIALIMKVTKGKKVDWSKIKQNL